MRNEDKIMSSVFRHLPQKIACTGTGDRDRTGLGISRAEGDPLQNIANGLRGQGQMAVLLAVFYSAFNKLLNGRANQESRKLARSLQIRFDYYAAQTLPHVFRH